LPFFVFGEQGELSLVGKLAAGTPQDIVIKDNLAYVASGGMGLVIYDVSNPTSPKQLSFCDTPGDAQDVAVVGDYAYVADKDKGLQIIDIRNSQNPVLSGSCDTLGDARGVAVVGDYAYVAAGERGLQIIDIRNPRNPTLVSSYDTPGDAKSVATSGNYIYLVGEKTGFWIFEFNPNVTSFSPSVKIKSFSYPNPFFNQECFIPIKAKGKRVRIYNILGQLVRELKGLEVYWDGQEECSLEVSAGVYFYEVERGGVRRMVRVR
jgi:hypothetical protein